MIHRISGTFLIINNNFMCCNFINNSVKKNKSAIKQKPRADGVFVK